MKILPLKSEVDCVVAVLDDFESYENDRAMAKQLVKSLYQELAKRETYAVALRGEIVEAFWPFLYEADARKFSERLPGLPSERRYLLKMRSPLGDLEAREKRVQQAKDAGQHLAWLDKHRASPVSEEER